MIILIRLTSKVKKKKNNQIEKKDTEFWVLFSLKAKMD